MCVLFVFVFFFKQKTAYEMRISDWSSDVCSSDLAGSGYLGEALYSRSPSRIDISIGGQTALLRDLCDTMKHGSLCALGGFTPYPVLRALYHFHEDFGAPAPVRQAAAQTRKRAVKGQSGSVRVDLAGARIVKKTN